MHANYLESYWSVKQADNVIFKAIQVKDVFRTLLYPSNIIKTYWLLRYFISFKLYVQSASKEVQ